MIRFVVPPVVAGIASSLTFVYLVQSPIVSMAAGLVVLSIVALALRRR